MVDFQSRDTRRGPAGDDESESEADSSSDGTESNEDDMDANEGADGDAAETDGVAGATPAENEPETGDPLAEDAGPGAADADEPEPAEPTDAHTVDAETTGDPLGDPTEAVSNAGEAGEAADMASETSEATDTAGETAETAGVASETDVAGETAGAAAEATRDGPERATTEAAPSRSVDVAVVTVAGDRDTLEDTVATAFEAAGHDVVQRERLRGGYDGIQEMVDTLVGREAVDVVVTVGGVGLTADDMAVEAVHPLLEKALPGFGEAFRSRLADHVGTGIVGVRSAAGVSDGTLVFCLPGDAEAATLAVEGILATEAPVLLDQLDG